MAAGLPWALFYLLEIQRDRRQDIVQILFSIEATQ
jgi:hypothetical protein